MIWNLIETIGGKVLDIVELDKALKSISRFHRNTLRSSP